MSARIVPLVLAVTLLSASTTAQDAPVLDVRSLEIRRLEIRSPEDRFGQIGPAETRVAQGAFHEFTLGQVPAGEVGSGKVRFLEDGAAKPGLDNCGGCK